ncbi:nucleoside kinase [Prevotella copri]|jgi:uridine kinase|uniref:Nucleoside kinase n=1 Tax=Segatella copri TaxID=165179 RepID=A0AA90ZYI8_9BACT|nr:nucleoside kinase [Segatella copri]MCE4122867.1 nucleoside kinase [Segatella copri]MCP9499191.1 nucleoside kinase [Segatella copri]MCP9514034.1 nucleoside kinase [Segatella copri]MCP9523178.1 nucleoside kinase [Segatella copri]MCW4084694.1 nucleoside kinase [Segatella copri]
MKQVIQIRCKNNKKSQKVEIGSTLFDIFSAFDLKMTHGPVSARVNNKVEGMHYRVYNSKDVEFLDMTSSSGSRAYTRTLFFVLCKAVQDIYPATDVVIDIPVSNGFYVDIRLGRPVVDEDVNIIRRRMQEIIDARMPIRRFTVPTEEAVALFQEKGDVEKVKLLKTSGSIYTTYYKIGDYVDYYYGTLLTNTSQLYLFGLEKYYDGMLLRIPSLKNPDVLGEMTRQDKMFEIFKEHHRWQSILGIRTVGDFNQAIDANHSTDIINISEALQEKKIANIAEEIASRKGVKLVLLAGPSSSGKTTSCKRLSIQLAVNGLKPLQISLDDYFVDREKTPKDASGEYDYESIYALDLDLINEQFNALFRGEEVELPKYDFQSGKSKKSGNKLKMNDNNVLVVEGIHALNPELTAHIPQEQIFRVYASALTTILLDNHNYIPTTDNRLLRRIIRDYKYRGVSAQETIHRWPSVRAGENKWIFPFQENADAMLNTAMLYELAVIKTQAEPLLQQVPENCEEYAEAYRLLKFLKYFKGIPYNNLPPTSLLREFLGGSSFHY